MNALVLGNIRITRLGHDLLFLAEMLGRISDKFIHNTVQCRFRALLFHGPVKIIDHPEQDLMLFVHGIHTGGKTLIPLEKITRARITR